MTPLTLRFDQETDGRTIAAIEELPGCLVYGSDQQDARHKVIVLALQVVADQIEHGEWPDGLPALQFVEG